MRALVVNMAGAAVALSGLCAAVNVTEWKSRSIYQVMIDRYARTDGSTTAECEAHLFCGGTWAGLTKHLDYIQDMGFTAIQISPIIKNIEEHTAVGDAYHGYWPVDNYALNDRFGTEDDFKQLVDELHKRDILVMLDVVVNHMAQAFDGVVPPKIDFSKFKPFDDKKYFHTYCNVTEEGWKIPKEYQECWLYPYGIALADLATETPAVADELNKWIKDLVPKYDIDGLRIDAAKHVNDAFLPKFVEAAGVFSIGEVLSGVTDDMCRYQSLNLLQGMPNYLEYYPLVSAFNGGSFESLAAIRNEAATGCTDIYALGTFIENHDMPRFASLNEDEAIAANAMTYVLLNDGIPTVYQGQEQHFKGNGTPFNREPLWQSGYDKEAPLYKLTATLNKVRNNAIKLSENYVESKSEVLVADTNHFCQKKGPYGSQVVFCITNKSSKGDAYDMPIGGFQSGDEVIEVINCQSTTANVEGSITGYFGKGEPRVYITAQALKDTGLCPKTTAAGPHTGAASGLNVATGTLVAVAAAWVALILA